jgi:sec1 family domain-containing protein 1
MIREVYLGQVLDQFLAFITPSPSLFSLLPSTKDVVDPSPVSLEDEETTYSYRVLNDPKTPEHLIESEITRIVNGLFSVVVTLGQVPYIRCPRGNAAEMVAKKLEVMIRDAIVSSSRTATTYGNLFPSDTLGYSALQRPRKLEKPHG